MSFGTERLRRALFTLSPLAFAAAAWLMPVVDPVARLGLAYDRQGAEEKARRSLERRGLEVADAEVRFSLQTDDALERYLRLRADGSPGAVAEVRRLAPPFQAKVEFIARTGTGDATVWLAPDGRVLGMSLAGAEEGGEAKEPEGPAAEALERAFLESWLGPERSRGLAPATRVEREVPDAPAPAEAPGPEGEEAREGAAAGEEDPGEEAKGLGDELADDWQGAPGDRFWTVALPGLAELTLAAATRSAEGEVAGWGLRAEVEEEFSKARLKRRQASAALRFGSLAILVLASGVMLFWGLWRYWLRFREAEVSHARTLLLAFTFALFVGVGLFYLLESSNVVAELDGEFSSGLLAITLITITTAISVLPLGLLLGAVWSGCEGDVREIFPARLVPLDTVLAGRWLGRGPAHSFLVGGAGAAWVVLAQLLIWLPVLGRPEWGPDLSVRRLLLVHPFQAGLAVALVVLVPYSALGLMAPLSLLRRWTASRWRTLPVLVLFLGLVCLQLPQVWMRLPTFGSLLSAGIWVAAFLVPFFAVDLMAAFWTFLLAHLGLLILVFFHQPAEALRVPAVAVGLGLAALLGVAALIARYGREVSAVEVRPGYARNMLERVALSAELSAAQQARARMLPAEPPEVPGARLSACCSLGEAAEGDYYDFLPRPDGSLAVVAADFGRQGLAAALRVTLAKGFLLSYSDRGLDPVQASCKLRQRLDELVQDPAEISLVYGVYRPRERLLRLASDLGGVWILVRRSSGDLEEVLKVSDRRPLEEAPEAAAVQEVRLEAGDTAVFLVFGEGLADHQRRRTRKALKRRRLRDAQGVLEVLRKRGVTPGTVLWLQAGEELP